MGQAGHMRPQTPPRKHEALIQRVQTLRALMRHLIGRHLAQRKAQPVETARANIGGAAAQGVQMAGESAGVLRPQRRMQISQNLSRVVQESCDDLADEGRAAKGLKRLQGGKIEHGRPIEQDRALLQAVRQSAQSEAIDRFFQDVVDAGVRH